MNKILVLISFLFVLAGCGNNSGDSKDKAGDNNSAAASDDPKAQKGLELVAKSDCFTCHKVAESYTGPAYMAVSERYHNKPEMIDTLAAKIIKGGSGNWGTVPMIAHPSISQEDARSMVEYILSLKK